MDPVAELAAYEASVNTNVTTKVTVDSISPVDVGDIGTDLADLFLPYLQAINAYGLTGGTAVPSDVDGEDLDQYVRINGSRFYIYRKVGGLWGTPLVDLAFGAIFPDGPLVNLRVAVDGFDVEVTPGGWVIDNVIYQKLTATTFTIPAADLNFFRYDLIYADESNQILYSNGTAASTPNFPTTPANCIVVDYIIVPSSSSGALPYSYYGAAGVIPYSDKYLAFTSDSSGEYDFTTYLGGDPLPAIPALKTLYAGNYSQPMGDFNLSTRIMSGLQPSTAYTLVY